jgi:hypothetical protein
VQHQRQPLGGRQLLQDDQQRQPDRVAQQYLPLRFRRIMADDRVRQVHPQRLLPPDGAGTQHVQAYSRDNGGQPAVEVLHAIGAHAADPQPGLLHGIVGLAERAQHPVGHRPQVGSVGLEALGKAVALGHRHIPSPRSVITVTVQPRPM